MTFNDIHNSAAFLGKGEVDSSILSGSTMSVWPPTPPRTRMTPQQVNLIKSSFATIFFTRDESAKLFYDRLFTVAPRLRPLFKSDMESQGRKLMDTLSLAVTALRHPQSLDHLLY